MTIVQVLLRNLEHGECALLPTEQIYETYRLNLSKIFFMFLSKKSYVCIGSLVFVKRTKRFRNISRILGNTSE